MNIPTIIVLSVSLLFVLATFASFLKWSHWWIRMFDFPRLQIGTVLILMIIASFIFYPFNEWWQFVVVGLLILSVAYQAYKIFKFTFLAKKQVRRYKGNDKKKSVSLIVSNVLQTNRKAGKLIQLVNEMKPDMLLTLETDKWWEQQLEVLEKDYQYTLKKPQDNLYGMILYSKLELKETEVKFLIKTDIPSFEALVQLDEDETIQIYCLHPKPPFPSESDTSDNRDGELLLVGKKIKNDKEPILVFGDLNDVAWSHSTRLFQKISRLLDPRIGRGFFNTFHAGYPLMRWPLDHIFHSTHFKLIQFKRLKNIGSDHFPIYVELYLQSSFKEAYEEPKADKEEKERAREKIQRADPIRKTVKK